MKNLSLKSVREYLLFVFRYDYVMPKKKKVKRCLKQRGRSGARWVCSSLFVVQLLALVLVHILD